MEFFENSDLKSLGITDPSSATVLGDSFVYHKIIQETSLNLGTIDGFSSECQILSVIQ